MLVPLYFGSAIMFRVMQAELDNLKLIAVLGIIHGAVEVLERSTVVFIDHICHVILKRQLAPWGTFRTPRRERLMADITILGMLCESTAIVSVNGLLYLYQFIYSQNISLLKLLQEFAIHTSVPLVIEWFFTGVSLAIETHFQNIAVMAVWRKRWKRHWFHWLFGRQQISGKLCVGALTSLKITLAKCPSHRELLKPNCR